MLVTKGSLLKNIFTYFFFLIVILAAFIPILWIGITSIKRTIDVFTYPPVIIPKNPAFDNYIKIFKLAEMRKTFLNR